MKDYKEAGYKFIGMTSQGLEIYKNVNKDQPINVATYAHYFKGEFLGESKVWADITGSLPLPMVSDEEIV